LHQRAPESAREASVSRPFCGGPEHILKLPKRVCPVKVAFFCSLVELRDGFINGKFDTIFTVILVDLNLTFVT
jgi:hypothetical protein